MVPVTLTVNLRYQVKVIHICFASGGRSTLRCSLYSTVLHNDPAAPQDQCVRCRIQTQDLCPNGNLKKFRFLQL